MSIMQPLVLKPVSKMHLFCRDGTLRVWSCGQEKCLEPPVALNDVANCCDIVHIDGLDEFNFPPFEDQGDVDMSDIDRSNEVGTKDKLVCVGGENGFVALVNLHARRIVHRFKAGSAVNTVRFYGCSHLMVGCEDGSISIHKLSQMDAAPSITHDSNSSVLRILPMPGRDGFVGARGDGTCVFYPIVPNNSGAFRQALFLDAHGSRDPHFDYVLDIHGERLDFVRKCVMSFF